MVLQQYLILRQNHGEDPGSGNWPIRPYLFCQGILFYIVMCWSSRFPPSLTAYHEKQFLGEPDEVGVMGDPLPHIVGHHLKVIPPQKRWVESKHESGEENRQSLMLLLEEETKKD